MGLPIKRSDHRRLQKMDTLNIFCKSDIECITQSAQWLLERLYIPHAKMGCRASHNDIKKYGLNKDPINWGDLSVVHVSRKGGSYCVDIEEASQDAVHLQAYISLWLKRWGWGSVEVRTLW